MPLEFTHVTVAGFLVPLEEMKDQLHETDPANDATVIAISHAAQDEILAGLTTAADPAWTDLTAPWPVKQAIKILTTHYYQHRGDDMNPSASGASPDRDVREAIRQMLSMYRDPTLA